MAGAGQYVSTGMNIILSCTVLVQQGTDIGLPLVGGLLGFGNSMALHWQIIQDELVCISQMIFIVNLVLVLLGHMVIHVRPIHCNLFSH